MVHDLLKDGDLGDGDCTIEQKTCRICLQGCDGGDSSSMIAPCRCRGTSKWVHRACLNRWRVHQPNRAFSRCTECSFDYRMQVPYDRYGVSREWNRCKFYLFVSRDFLLATLLLQAIIASLAWLISAIDQQRYVVDYFSNDCSNEWCNHTLSLYYLCGVLTLVMLFGIVGSCVLCYNRCSFQKSLSLLLSPIVASPLQEETEDYYDYERADGIGYRRSSAGDGRGDGCCAVCWTSPGTNTHFYGCENLCCCNCGDVDTVGCSGANHHHGSGGCGDSDGPCAYILLLLLIVSAFFMAVLGLVVGVVLSVVCCQRIVQRHIFLIQKKQLVEEFVVMDLSDYELTNHTSFESANKHHAIPSTKKSAPDTSMCLSEEDRNRLWKLGLMDKT